MTNADVDVVVVLYHSADSIQQAITSLSTQDATWTLHLVDNNPGDGSLEAALSVAPADVRVHCPGSNIGFGGGCNLAIANGTAPYVLLLNPDAHLEPHCLDRLRAALEGDPGLAAVGPLVLRSTDGKIDSAGMELVAPGWTRDRKRGYDLSEAPASGEVRCLSGGILLLRRKALEVIKRTDAPFWDELFLYNEDVELSLALTTAGCRLGYERDARAIHAVGGSGGDRRLTQALAARNRILTAISYLRLSDILHPFFGFLWLRRIILDLPRLWTNLHQKELRTKLPDLIKKAMTRRQTMKEIRQAYQTEKI